MEKVFVKVDYQVLAGGAIRPTRIHWHDGRTVPPSMTSKEFATRYLSVVRKNIYTELMISGMLSQFNRRWTLDEKLHFIR